jgi:hypothetical protein
MAIFRMGSYKSGEPGSRALFLRAFTPRWLRIFRTASSGAVPACRTRAISAERLGVVTSLTLFEPPFRRAVGERSFISQVSHRRVPKGHDVSMFRSKRRMP